MEVVTENLPAGVLYRTTWGNYKTEARRAYGCAARRNRYRPGTFGEKFRRTGQPVLFSCHPVCGCTSGQHAGAPDSHLTEQHVTCSKCGPPVKA